MAALPPDSPPPQAKPTVKWPNKRENYELLDVIGSGATSVVQAARCIPLNENVAIKRIDLERCGSSIEELQKEITLMSNCNHTNVIKYYTSFVVKDELWLIMKLMSGGSLLDIIKHVVTKGTKCGVLDEVVIATVLKEVLQGLEYFHNNGQIHRDVKAGNVLVGVDGSIQLCDFGVSNWLHDPQLRVSSKTKKMPRNTFVGTPCWMAPEVMDQSVGYNEKADIWSFGITALELATGTAPYAKFPPMKVLMLTLENPSPTLETCGDLNSEDYKKNYSKSFQKMVEKCLMREPEKRLSASELLKLSFFKKARNTEFIKDVVLGDAPSLQSRAKKVRRVPGASGRLYKTEDGGWVWSDDEFVEEYEESKESLKLKSESGPQLTPETTPSSHPLAPPLTSPPAAANAPSIQIQPPSQPAQASPEITSLQQQSQALQSQLQQTLQQLAVSQQEHQKMASLQQTNPAQFTHEQHLQSMKVLEKLQSLERQKQQCEFQLQQVALQLQQALASQAMENQFQAAMKLQQQTPQPIPKPIMKMVLRKRDEKQGLKDIKFDFVPGKDTSDGMAKDLIAAGLIDGRNLVVVAANILKLVENTSLERVVFQIASGVPPEQLDDKKLIGYAQLSVLQDQ